MEAAASFEARSAPSSYPAARLILFEQDQLLAKSGFQPELGASNDIRSNL